MGLEARCLPHFHLLLSGCRWLHFKLSCGCRYLVAAAVGPRALSPQSHVCRLNTDVKLTKPLPAPVTGILGESLDEKMTKLSRLSLGSTEGIPAFSVL